ncbi:hypothetical protein [Haloglomus litoreum]|uniref:hypothetical protein n=1 Tax=Haloglomus litoreum TaxID=3034026 RepID=UPI0023E831E7|nr:hypothetical protein [Haloglomus sp. DT116]
MSDQVVHLEELFGAEVLVWRSGRATVCPWDDTTDPESPAARDLAGLPAPRPDQPPVDGHYVDQELTDIVEAIQAANVPLAVRLLVESKAENIRAELDPTSVRTEAE